MPVSRNKVIIAVVADDSLDDAINATDDDDDSVNKKAGFLRRSR